MTGPSASPPPHHLQRVVGKLPGKAIGIDLSIPSEARLRSVLFGQQFYKLGWDLAVLAPSCSPCPEGGPARLAREEGGRAGVEGCLLGGFGATFVLVLVLLFVPTPTRAVFLKIRSEPIIAPGRQLRLFPFTLLFWLGIDFLFPSFPCPPVCARRS